MGLEEQLRLEAEKTFGSKAKADAWLNQPRAMFGGSTALQHATTEAGFREISDLLVRISEGYTF